jgi:Tfp pilus assembly protein PilZ
MGDLNLEKRTCLRFRIPGASVSYKKDKPFLKKGEDYIEEFCPVLDISRGGIRFLSQEILKFESKVALKISIPGETIPMTIKGIVRWYSPNPGKSYKYQIGVQFLPYGEKKDQNNPAVMTKIVALEQKFLDESGLAEQGRKDKDEFSI